MVKVNTIYACCNIHCEGLALLSNNVVNTFVCCYIHFHTLTLASYGQAMLLMEVVARTEKLEVEVEVHHNCSLFSPASLYWDCWTNSVGSRR